MQILKYNFQSKFIFPFQQIYHFIENNKKLDEYGRPFPPKRGKYYTPGLTTDAVVYRKRPDTYHDILLVTRKNNPYAGYLALPGGLKHNAKYLILLRFVEYNEEPYKGCLRELKEETNLDGKNVQLLCVKGDPLRDPRSHIVTIGYLVEVDESAKPVGGDDAAKAEFYPLQDILKQKDKIAFDHYQIIVESLSKLNKQYVPV